MSNPLESLTLAAGSEALPLELLQPLDSNNPASTPVHLSGPEQRLIVKDGESRSIWPVHLAGWQALGWQQQTDSATPGPEPEQPDPQQPEPDQEAGPDGEPEPEPVLEPALEREPAATTELEPPTETATSDGEALLASEPPDFQAMTKAQIVDYCSAVHGVELDASQTKAELIEQATALEAHANDTAAADLAALELGDALL